jgi:hypothetical protein
MASADGEFGLVASGDGSVGGVQRLTMRTMRLHEIRANLRRGRGERRKLLTKPERFVAWTFALLPGPLALVGVVLLIGGRSGARVVGIVLALSLLGMTVPISPFLKARVRRREAGAEREQ